MIDIYYLTLLKHYKTCRNFLVGNTVIYLFVILAFLYTKTDEVMIYVYTVANIIPFAIMLARFLEVKHRIKSYKISNPFDFKT